MMLSQIDPWLKSCKKGHRVHSDLLIDSERYPEAQVWLRLAQRVLRSYFSVCVFADASSRTGRGDEVTLSAGEGLSRSYGEYAKLY
jgi:hypothetical protein